MMGRTEDIPLLASLVCCGPPTSNPQRSGHRKCPDNSGPRPRVWMCWMGFSPSSKEGHLVPVTQQLIIATFFRGSLWMIPERPERGKIRFEVFAGLSSPNKTPCPPVHFFYPQHYDIFTLKRELSLGRLQICCRLAWKVPIKHKCEFLQVQIIPS